MKKVEYNTGTELAIKVIFGADFGLSVRMLEARTEETANIPELANAIESLVSYNGFVGSDVARALRRLDDKDLIVTASFGRESSPVLYVCPNTNLGMTPEEVTEIYEKIMNELKWTQPAELHPVESTLNSEPREPNNACLIQAWWD